MSQSILEWSSYLLAYNLMLPLDPARIRHRLFQILMQKACQCSLKISFQLQKILPPYPFLRMYFFHHPKKVNQHF